MTARVTLASRTGSYVAGLQGAEKGLHVAVNVLLAVAALYVGYKLYRLIDDLGLNKKESYDPTSDKNLAYRAANAATQAVTGDPTTSLGSTLYDVTDSVSNWIKGVLPGLESREEKAAREQEELRERAALARAAKQFEYD